MVAYQGRPTDLALLHAEGRLAEYGRIFNPLDGLARRDERGLPRGETEALCRGFPLCTGCDNRSVDSLRLRFRQLLLLLPSQSLDHLAAKRFQRGIAGFPHLFDFDQMIAE